jgi:hypothetical protein
MVRNLLPNFFIAGAAKCGTSSLDRYLGQHPQIFIPPKKEAHYFSIPSFPKEFKGPGDDGMNLYTIRERDAYYELFTGAEGYKAIGESSVFYLYYPSTAERIHRENPEAKIIILLRNPVDRAFSAYMHLVRDERENLSFEHGLEQEDERKQRDFEPMWLYKELGLYSKQVEHYFEVFGPRQVKVILFEDFIRNTDAVVADVLEFLNVTPSFQIDTSLQLNESGKPKSRWMYNFISKPNPLKEVIKPLVPNALRERLGIKAKSLVLEKVAMESQTRQRLHDYFAEDIARLEGLLNRDLSIWQQRSHAG